MNAIGLFWLQYLLGNYAACVNAKEADLQGDLPYESTPCGDVRGAIKVFNP